ncbi:hypothetical protein HK105_208448 [Polyrhizophydium stewartii]|uniref:Uncharacterized protein n=1 Tax=Polyrhizophydium stewartii TaxID=2732419 RepID=A0ABR4MXV6_9FUNG
MAEQLMVPIDLVLKHLRDIEDSARLQEILSGTIKRSVVEAIRTISEAALSLAGKSALPFSDVALSAKLGVALQYAADLSSTQSWAYFQHESHRLLLDNVSINEDADIEPPPPSWRAKSSGAAHDPDGRRAHFQYDEILAQMTTLDSGSTGSIAGGASSSGEANLENSQGTMLSAIRKVSAALSNAAHNMVGRKASVEGGASSSRGALRSPTMSAPAHQTRRGKAKRRATEVLDVAAYHDAVHGQSHDPDHSQGSPSNAVLKSHAMREEPVIHHIITVDRSQSLLQHHVPRAPDLLSPSPATHAESHEVIDTEKAESHNSIHQQLTEKLARIATDVQHARLKANSLRTEFKSASSPQSFHRPNIGARKPVDGADENASEMIPIENAGGQDNVSGNGGMLLSQSVYTLPHLTASAHEIAPGQAPPPPPPRIHIQPSDSTALADAVNTHTHAVIEKQPSSARKFHPNRPQSPKMSD